MLEKLNLVSAAEFCLESLKAMHTFVGNIVQKVFEKLKVEGKHPVYITQKY